MKKCLKCTKPAVLHITDIQEGEVHELHLCESCAQEYMFQQHETQDDDEDTSFLSDSEGSSSDELRQLDKLACPQCETTFKTFRKEGRLGCPYCYDAFYSELLPLLENIQDTPLAKHVGKFPKRTPHGSRERYQLIQLRNHLRLAIDEENYEMAAELRDEIQQIEQSIEDDETH